MPFALSQKGGARRACLRPIRIYPFADHYDRDAFRLRGRRGVLLRRFSGWIPAARRRGFARSQDPELGTSDVLFGFNTSLNPLTDLDRLEIYVNESGSFADTDTPKAVLSAVDPTTNHLPPPSTSPTLPLYLSKGIAYQVSMRAVAVTGLKSDFSPPASFSF